MFHFKILHVFLTFMLHVNINNKFFWEMAVFSKPNNLMYEWGYVWMFFSSAGKESACNAGDAGSIPGSRRSPKERTGYSLQYSWASLMAQMVKKQHAMQQTWIWSLSWEDLLEVGMATHSSILPWGIPMDRGTWWAIVHGVTKSQIRLCD